MAQKRRTSSQSTLNTPPNSPSQSPSHPIPWNDAHEIIDMTKAGKVMQITTAPGSPAVQTSSLPVTPEYLKQLFLKAVQAISKLDDSVDTPEVAGSRH